MPRLRSTARLIGWILLAILALAVLLAAVVLWQVHRSAPTLDGQVRVQGLQASVTVSRDALGTAVVKGANRLDVARGLGFVHAQERFFEMDLTRRSAAGELSALFGSLALERDKLRRTHRMRAMLTARLARMDADERALLQAYADGVNAGLAQLGTRPWQYGLLRAEPARWQPVDSLLVIAEMFWMLQGNSVQEGLARAHCASASAMPLSTGWSRAVAAGMRRSTARCCNPARCRGPTRSTCASPPRPHRPPRPRRWWRRPRPSSTTRRRRIATSR